MRFFSYRLDNQDVGLMAICRPDNTRHPYKHVIEAKLENEDIAANSDDIDSEIEKMTDDDLHDMELPNVIDKMLEFSSPAVENACDILTEHALRIAGPKGILTSVASFPEAEQRSKQLGAHEGGDGDMILNPRQVPQWKTNSEGEWQRAEKPEKYLTNAPEGDTTNEPPTSGMADTSI